MNDEGTDEEKPLQMASVHLRKPPADHHFPDAGDVLPAAHGDVREEEEQKRDDTLRP